MINDTELSEKFKVFYRNGPYTGIPEVIITEFDEIKTMV